MTAIYYMMYVYDFNSQWYPEFGDADKEVVEAERQHYLDNGYKTEHIMIVKTNGQQADIDSKTIALNK